MGVFGHLRKACFLCMGIGLLLPACKGRIDPAEPPPGKTPVAIAPEPVGEFGTFEVALGGHVEQADIDAGKLGFLRVFELGDVNFSPAAAREKFTGFSYYPHPNVVFEVEARRSDTAELDPMVPEPPDMVNFGIGWWF